MNDQNNSEKNPLDELFARRLGKLERPPSPDSFARLQQRMQGKQEEPRILLWWQQSTVQLAAAASVAGLLLLGWFYVTNEDGRMTGSVETSVAVRTDVDKPARSPSEKPNQQNVVLPNSADRLAQNTPTSGSLHATHKPVGRNDSRTITVAHSTERTNQLHAVVVKNKIEKPISTALIDKISQPAEAIAALPSPHIPVKERVLVVTIEEPEALVAARQTAASVVNNMPVLAASPSREGKATFWQQVKRLKQDDDVARQDDGPNDDSGLLGRAYKGIRHRLEKDKPAKP